MKKFSLELLRKQKPNTAIPYLIGPEAAQMILDAQRNFRTTQKQTIRKYARDMMNDDWVLNGSDSIVIELNDEPGLPIVGFNGQHRMAAVVRANKEVPFLVFLSESAVDDTVYDRGRPRTIAQVLAHLGEDNAKHKSAIARLMIVQQGEHRSEGTVAVIASSLTQYKDAIEYVVENLSQSKRGLNASLKTAVARAYYVKGQRTRLQEFCQRIYSLELERPEDDSLFRLLNLMNSGKTNNRQYYLKCERAVHAFLESKPMEELRPVTHPGQLLPIPPFDFPALPRLDSEKKREVRSNDTYKPQPGSVASAAMAVLNRHKGDWMSSKDIADEIIASGEFAGRTTRQVTDTVYTALRIFRDKTDCLPTLRFEKIAKAGNPSFRYAIMKYGK